LAESKEDSITDAQFATNSPVIPLQNPLWDHACQVYSQVGVEAELLVLQDEHGADINLILQALWLATEGIEWTPECIPEGYQPWVTEQVIPIRNIRRRLKTDWVEKRGVAYEGFRQQVKKLELQAEQYALAILYVHNATNSSEVKKKATKRKGVNAKGASKSGPVFLAEDNLKRLGESMNILPEHFHSLITTL
jgi:uncharacterized protein (TIGR02444 family)